MERLVLGYQTPGAWPSSWVGHQGPGPRAPTASLHRQPRGAGAPRPAPRGPQPPLRLPFQFTVECHGNTLLPQFLGMYRLTVDGVETYMVVTRNVFSHRLTVHRKYDLKVKALLPSSARPAWESGGLCGCGRGILELTRRGRGHQRSLEVQVAVRRGY